MSATLRQDLVRRELDAIVAKLEVRFQRMTTRYSPAMIAEIRWALSERIRPRLPGGQLAAGWKKDAPGLTADDLRHTVGTDGQ